MITVTGIRIRFPHGFKQEYKDNVERFHEKKNCTASSYFHGLLTSGLQKDASHFPRLKEVPRTSLDYIQLPWTPQYCIAHNCLAPPFPHYMQLQLSPSTLLDYIQLHPTSLNNMQLSPTLLEYLQLLRTPWITHSCLLVLGLLTSLLCIQLPRSCQDHIQRTLTTLEYI